MRSADTALSRIAGFRYGFMIADEVLRDTLTDFAEGRTDRDELMLAVRQQRLAYEGYLARLNELLEPVATA